jgi:ankyrin repeat protein
MRFLFCIPPALLLACCVPPSAWNRPPIVGAARDGDTARLEELLATGADPEVHAGVNGWTPLLHAIHKNQAGSVRVLLAHHADVNSRGDGGMTPLIMAAGYGYTDIVRILLQAGADATLKGKEGRDALEAAVSGVGDIDRFTLGHCQTETVRALLAANPNLKLREDFWSTASVHIARFAGCREMLSLLENRPKRSHR